MICHCALSCYATPQDKDRLRINLLDAVPGLRAALRSGVWPSWLNKYVTPW